MGLFMPVLMAPLPGRGAEVLLSSQGTRPLLVAWRSLYDVEQAVADAQEALDQANDALDRAEQSGDEDAITAAIAAVEDAESRLDAAQNALD